MNDEKIEKPSKWEIVDINDNGVTDRLKVEGGYLYHTCHQTTHTTTMCFVPEIDLTRYQAHLRDAYKAGYTDGQADAKVGIQAPIE